MYRNLSVTNTVSEEKKDGLAHMWREVDIQVFSLLAVLTLRSASDSSPHQRQPVPHKNKKWASDTFTTFIATFSNHHTYCFQLRSNCLYSDLLPSLPFLNLASQLGPKWESQVPSIGPFPFSSAVIWTVSGSAAPPTPTFGPCWLWKAPVHTSCPIACSLKGSLQTDGPPPTNTEPVVHPAWELIGKKPVNGCTVGLLHPHQHRADYLQVEWWNTGNTLQRNQANLPRRA